jgi:hypothetical protein
MPCDPAPNDVVVIPRRRSLLGDIVVVFGLMPPYVAFYPFIWARNRHLLTRWERETSGAVRGRWQLEGDRVRLCLGGEEAVIELSSIKSVQWTEHTLNRRFIGAGALEFLVRIELEDGTVRSLVLSGIDDEHPVFLRLRAEGKLGDKPGRGGQEQSVGTMALFAICSALAWTAIVLFGLWLRRHG